MHCVYIIESETSPGRHYVGLTMDVPRRVAEHNDGKSVHTAKFDLGGLWFTSLSKTGPKHSTSSAI